MPANTPSPAPSVGEIAELLDEVVVRVDVHGDVRLTDGEFDKLDAAAFRVRTVADVLGTLPDVRLGWHDYPAACIAFVARLRTALSDHQEPANGR